MKALGILKYRQKKLSLMTLPIPTISKDEILVQIKAASINPIDLKTRDGKLKMLLPYSMPLILGSDFSGVVTKIGDNVTTFSVGDNVYGRPKKNKIGTFAEYIAIDASEIALMPTNTTFEEAASLPLVGLTSYQAIHDIMAIKPGDKVLIQAGAGGVGTFAIQLAKHFGAFVATTVSSKGESLVKEIGADQLINYREQDFSVVLSDFDYVFDTLGGDSLKKAFKSVKPMGKIVSVSGLPNRRFAIDYQVPFWKKWLFTFATFPISSLERKHSVDYYFLFMKPSGEQLNIITSLVETGSIKPVIDRVYSFDNAQEALDYSESGRAKGKIIIKMS